MICFTLFNFNPENNFLAFNYTENSQRMTVARGRWWWWQWWVTGDGGRVVANIGGGSGH
jgi:hypothetical protein